MSVAEDVFTPEAVRARIAERLLQVEPLETEEPLGDHSLNADLLPPEREKLRRAAVLVPLVPRGGDMDVLLTKRTGHLPNHAGQVAFPGGKIEPEDESAALAALREAEEEIGLDRAHVEIVGFLDPYLSRTGFHIQPCVGIVGEGFALVPDRREVDYVFEVPLRFLMAPANHQRQSRMWHGRERHFYAMPFGEHYIWGVTAGIIRNLYERLFA